MKTQNIIPKNIDEYIALFPSGIQEILRELRTTIQKAAPKAEEVISYQMPAYKYHGILVYFAAHKNHIGFYPRASVIEIFKNELSGFKVTKGTIQFPFGKPIPLELITKIVKFRVSENLKQAETDVNKK